MASKFFHLTAFAVALAAGASCNHKLTTTDVQVARIEEDRAASQAHLTYMVDNAIVQDMSIADFHFVGHTTELSGVGVARLDRMAHLLNTYGGTVRYETNVSDEELIAQRLENVRKYLTLTGCDTERVEVVTMMSGGGGMAADKAIEIYERGPRPPVTEAQATPVSALLGG